MRIFALFILGLLCSHVYAQSQISFVEESIDFKLNHDYFEVNGLYWFVNQTDHVVQGNIVFPFGLSKDSVDVIRVFNLASGQSLAYGSLENSILFRITLPAQDTVGVNIAYRQPLMQKNVYILRSTQSWGKPLLKAKYSLTVEDSLVVKEFSYPADTVSGNIYYWEKENFMPDKEFEVVIKESSD